MSLNLLPQSRSRDRGAFSKVFEFRPYNAGMNFLFGGRERRKTTIAASKDVFASHDFRKSNQSLSDQLRMLDKRC